MKWNSVAEIARKTRIPAPTARRYASLFKEFLGGSKMGRVTKYPDESIPIFERISNLYQEGRVTHEIEDVLRSEVPRTIDVEPSAPAQAQPFNTELAVAFTDMMEKVSSCMEIIADQKSLIETQQNDIQKLKTAFVMLARSQKKLRSLPAPDHTAHIKKVAAKTRDLEQKDQELEEMALGLSFDTSDLKAKLQTLESELVRLRKDRREMEKYLQEKIERLKETME